MTLATLIVAAAIATTITLSPLLVQLAVGVLIPIGTGLLTKSGASAGLKQAITIVLAGLSAVITSSVVDGGASVFTLETLAYAAIAWIIAIATYAGVYKTHSIDERLAPDRGLGAIDTTGVEKG